MIIKMQVCIFIMIGMVAWHGVDSALAKAEKQGEWNVIKNMSIAQLSEIETSK